MAAIDQFRSPASERAAAVAVLLSACEIVDAHQADKPTAFGYVAAIFENTPFSWPNIMTGFYAEIDRQLCLKTKVESPTKSEPRDSSSQAAASDGEKGDSEEPAPQNASPTKPTQSKKHHRGLSGKQHKSVIENVKWLAPAEWHSFTPGAAATYLGINVDTLNERQNKAKSVDLGLKGRDLSAAIRSTITKKALPAPKRKRQDEVSSPDGRANPLFGKVFEDAKGIYLVTPLTTSVAASTTALTFKPKFEEPESVVHLKGFVEAEKVTKYQPSKAMQPPPQKVTCAKQPGDLNVYFVPWATDSDAMTVE